ncbi:hypothetical protein CC86DRAFT_338057 [Ophiobolus disseminans]|uniref:F-box domain-containing protein n=1 Tax=Ophiobolus disseminans TaxID=1469910 RepID=A0A6A7AIQ9_9PLEO|nr:hypothetical protein CC86DRAFT_338057 [Ophiobolus disseminans]
MAQEAPSSAVAFNSLPIELNQAIAREIENDKDLATYRLICRGTNDAVDADNLSFWRTKFREKFALKEGVANQELKQLYQNRTKQLARGTGYSFHRGHRLREKDVVKVLRELIVESFQGPVEFDDYGRPRCKNQAALLKFVLNSKLLLPTERAPAPSPRRNEPKDVHNLLAAVKLMCSHFLFELEGANHVFAAEESQQVVYMATNNAPLYGGVHKGEVNMNWMLHCMQFFRNHMMNEDVASLFHAMDDLSPRQKPSAWQEPLRMGTYPLGKHWKGTYSFLDVPEITKLRMLSPDQVGDAYFCDKNIDEGKIQSLQLNFGPEAKLKWLDTFEHHLSSMRSPVDAPLTTQGRSNPKTAFSAKDIQFTGTGVDLDDDFKAIGWLNALPPQQGIPGWQRITFMKHFMEDLDAEEQDNLWAYEGVVLPGGRIIIGRWWYASENVDYSKDYNGPFILWAVDEPEVEDSDDDDDDDEDDE